MCLGQDRSDGSDEVSFPWCLRIRKVQDAWDPTLALKRPATTVHVYDAVKTHMDEALQNARE